jgi:hypothetical protein
MPEPDQTPVSNLKKVLSPVKSQAKDKLGNDFGGYAKPGDKYKSVNKNESGENLWVKLGNGKNQWSYTTSPNENSNTSPITNQGLPIDMQGAEKTLSEYHSQLRGEAIDKLGLFTANVFMTIGTGGVGASARFAGFAGELINQTTAQLTQNGNIDFGNYDLLGFATSAALGSKANLGKDMIQGASSTFLSYTYNQGWDGAIMKKKTAGFIVTSSLGGMLSPMMNKTPVFGKVINESVGGAIQGLSSGAQDAGAFQY